MAPDPHQYRSYDSAPRGIGALIDTIQGLLQELPGVISDRVHLLTLELRRASSSAVWILAMVLAALMFGATAWVAMWVAIVLAIMELGWNWPWAIGAVFIVNVLVAVAAVFAARSKIGDLTLPATFRHLTTSGLAPVPAMPPAPAPSSSDAPIHEQHRRTEAARPADPR